MKFIESFKNFTRTEGGKKTINTTKNTVVTLIRAAFLLCMSYVLIYPLIYMLSLSVQSNSQLLDPSVVWVPTSVTFDNFLKAIDAMDYWKSLFFTLRVHIVSALIEVFVCAFVAYGFARFEFKGRNFIFFLVLLTILIPQEMIIIPLYVNFRNFNPFGIVSIFNSITGSDANINLLNTGLVFYIPSLLGNGLRSGLFIFIYRQFFKGLPAELEEAASIDGAGPIKTFLRIVLPSSGVAIITVTVFSLVWHWNEYYLTTMYFSEEKSLSVALSQISSLLTNIGISQYDMIVTSVSMAACVLTMAPMLIAYLFLQKYFIQSIDRVGIVG